MFHSIRKKQIILVRHAKAHEREEWNGNDFDRPLTDIGEKSNQIVANYLRLIGVKPDRIVASPAVRTRDTAEGMAKKLSGNVKVDYIPDLYNENCLPSRNSMEVHLSVVRNTKKTSKTLVIVGHNDDLTNFASYLSGEAVPSMKKGSVVVLSLPEGSDWKEVEAGKCKFIYYLTPQFLRLEELV